MITGTLKNQVDRIWTACWNNGISNPLTVIEQISYLLFIKRLDELHTVREKKANRLSQPIEDPIFGPDGQHMRWSKFKHFESQRMFVVVRDEAFPFIKNLHGDADSSYARHMKDAVFMVPTPALLADMVEKIGALPMDDRDTKGDLYEYMLSKLTTAGTNGQFRTPRHIIKMMVELVAPKPDDVICDPACGTAGFLVAAGEYLREHHGDLFFDEAKREHFNSSLFHGFDFDSSMLRIGSMNMMLHGVEDAKIERRDSLSEDNAGVEEEFTLALANPPFKGSLDYSTTAKNLLSTAKTKKTELLFVVQILRILKAGGRAAMIVPDGVLFGSSKAHQTIRRLLVEKHKLEAVLSLPSGVFKPYAGVSTGVLVFTKTNSGGTDHVWFYDMQADGFSLDDKRQPVDENDLPDLVARWQHREAEAERPRTAKSFMVPKAEIEANKYDLSINRYKEIVYEEVKYDHPSKILADLKTLEGEIQQDLEALEQMLAPTHTAS